MSEKAVFDTDNLIYNRFDLIHPEATETFLYEEEGLSYEICSFSSEGISEINVWGKQYPPAVFEEFVSDIFRERKVYAIEVTRGRNQYKDFLEETNDIRVPLPETFEELMNRSERRDRATIRRKLRWLDERVGALQIEVYGRSDIPESVVETYFKWKKETHGTEYGLTPAEYLDRYYVTDAMMMRAGDTEVAVAFFCQTEDIVFFENFSYNGELKEYSPGLLMYVKFMEELIRRKCRYMHLGGGSYVYKKRFGAESNVAYSGRIYRPEIVEGLNAFFADKRIGTVAFYGFGVCGHAFLQLAKNLKIDVLYGLDRGEPESDAIEIFKPEQETPAVDAILITLNNKNKEVEELLKGRAGVVLYWNDILKEVVDAYRRSVDVSD